MAFATPAPTRMDPLGISHPPLMHPFGLERLPSGCGGEGMAENLDPHITKVFHVLQCPRQGAFPHLIHLALLASA